MSEAWPNVSFVIRYTASRVETLADRLSQELSAPVADPFAEDLVLTRSGGIQRWLAQHLGGLLGAGGQRDGVCARVRFVTLPQFTTSVRTTGYDWSPGCLVVPVMAALDEVVDLDDFAQVRSHLADPMTRPSRRMNVVNQAASRFSAYARWNQPMLARWGAQELVSPDGNQLPPDQIWQAILWNRVCERLGTTSWLDAESDCRAAAEAGKRFSRIALFCPDRITPAEADFLAALDEANPITVFSLRHVRSEAGPWSMLKYHVPAAAHRTSESSNPTSCDVRPVRVQDAGSESSPAQH
ncbi:MAG: exodeoxyribonuclease V subunit gamma, partial [Propionibacteriaceae bacterium]|nr:exodeoxyribonuclease V subunit gamma [Propionibacteriaceae bacterium]